MKKVILALLLGALVTTGVFSDHPSGLGLGFMGRWGIGWGDGQGANGAAFSLKLPSIPIFWAATFDVKSNLSGFGFIGDRYFYHNPLFSDINLHWFIGVGAYVSFYIFSSSDKNYSSIEMGARIPVGLSWQPLELLEFFLNIAPSLGLAVDIGGNDAGLKFPRGGLPLEVGIRVWL